MKFVANLLVAIHTAAAGEAFALARKAGLDPAQMFEIVADGAGGSRALQVRGEMLIADNYLPIHTMPLELWRKDMQIIADFANAWPARHRCSPRRAPLQCGGRFRLRRSGHGCRLRRYREDGRTRLPAPLQEGDLIERLYRIERGVYCSIRRSPGSSH